MSLLKHTMQEPKRIHSKPQLPPNAQKVTTQTGLKLAKCAQKEVTVQMELPKLRAPASSVLRAQRRLVPIAQPTGTVYRTRTTARMGRGGVDRHVCPAQSTKLVCSEAMKHLLPEATTLP